MFEPPKYHEAIQSQYVLHNTMCPDKCQIIDDLGLPKYASYQTGWIKTLNPMQILQFVDQKRAEHLRMSETYREAPVKRAIAEKDRRGNLKLDMMPSSWNPHTLKRQNHEKPAKNHDNPLVDQKPYSIVLDKSGKFVKIRRNFKPIFGNVDLELKLRQNGVFFDMKLRNSIENDAKYVVNVDEDGKFVNLKILDGKLTKFEEIHVKIDEFGRFLGLEKTPKRRSRSEEPKNSGKVDFVARRSKSAPEFVENQQKIDIFDENFERRSKRPKRRRFYGRSTPIWTKNGKKRYWRNARIKEIRSFVEPRKFKKPIFRRKLIKKIENRQKIRKNKCFLTKNAMMKLKFNREMAEKRRRRIVEHEKEMEQMMKWRRNEEKEERRLWREEVEEEMRKNEDGEDVEMELKETIWWKNLEWMVVEKRGNQKKGWKYTLVPKSEFEGERTYRYVKSPYDVQHRRMRVEDQKDATFLAALPYPAPVHRVKAYPIDVAKDDADAWHEEQAKQVLERRKAVELAEKKRFAEIMEYRKYIAKVKKLRGLVRLEYLQKRLKSVTRKSYRRRKTKKCYRKTVEMLKQQLINAGKSLLSLIKTEQLIKNVCAKTQNDIKRAENRRESNEKTVRFSTFTIKKFNPDGKVENLCPKRKKPRKKRKIVGILKNKKYIMKTSLSMKIQRFLEKLEAGNDENDKFAIPSTSFEVKKEIKEEVEEEVEDPERKALDEEIEEIKRKLEIFEKDVKPTINIIEDQKPPKPMNEVKKERRRTKSIGGRRKRRGILKPYRMKNPSWITNRLKKRAKRKTTTTKTKKTNEMRILNSYVRKEQKNGMIGTKPARKSTKIKKLTRSQSVNMKPNNKLNVNKTKNGRSMQNVKKLLVSLHMKQKATEKIMEKRVRFKFNTLHKLRDIWNPTGWKDIAKRDEIDKNRGFSWRSENSIKSMKEEYEKTKEDDEEMNAFELEPWRDDEFEKGIDTQTEPIPFIEEFILDDHAVIGFSTLEDSQMFEERLAAKRRMIIEQHWKVEIEKCLAEMKAEDAENELKKAYWKHLQYEESQLQLLQAECAGDEERAEFEAVGRRVQYIMDTTGDIAFEQMEEYFMISEEFENGEETRRQEVLMLKKKMGFEDQCDQLIEKIEEIFSVEKLMLTMCMNRHLLIVKLMTVGQCVLPCDKSDIRDEVHLTMDCLSKERQRLELEHEERIKPKVEHYRRIISQLDHFVRQRSEEVRLSTIEDVATQFLSNNHENYDENQLFLAKRPRKPRKLVKIEPKVEEIDEIDEKPPILTTNMSREPSFNEEDTKCWKFRKNARRIGRNPPKLAGKLGFDMRVMMRDLHANCSMMEIREAMREQKRQKMIRMWRREKKKREKRTPSLLTRLNNAINAYNQLTTTYTPRIELLRRIENNFAQYLENEENRDILDTMSAERRMEFMGMLKSFTLNDMKELALEMQKQLIDKAINEMTKTKLEIESREQDLWLNSKAHKRRESRRESELDTYHQRHGHQLTAVDEQRINEELDDECAEQQRQLQLEFETAYVERGADHALQQHRAHIDSGGVESFVTPFRPPEKVKRKYTKRKNVNNPTDMKSPGSSSTTTDTAPTTIDNNHHQQQQQMQSVIGIAPQSAAAQAAVKRSTSDTPPSTQTKMQKLENVGEVYRNGVIGKQESLIGIAPQAQAQLQLQQQQQAAAAAAAAVAASNGHPIDTTRSLYVNTSIPQPSAQSIAPTAAATTTSTATHDALRLLQQSGLMANGLAPPFLAPSNGATIPFLAAQQMMGGPLNGLQFPANASLGSQLAGAALLAHQAAPKKPGRWFGMHVRIANDIQSAKKGAVNGDKSGGGSSSNGGGERASAPPPAPTTTNNTTAQLPAPSTTAPPFGQQQQPTQPPPPSIVVVQPSTSAPSAVIPPPQPPTTAEHQVSTPSAILVQQQMAQQQQQKAQQLAVTTASTTFAQFPPPQLAGGPTYAGTPQMMAAAIREASQRVAPSTKNASCRATPKPAQQQRPPSQNIPVSIAAAVAAAQQQQRLAMAPTTAGSLTNGLSAEAAATNALQMMMRDQQLQQQQLQNLLGQQQQQQHQPAVTQQQQQAAQVTQQQQAQAQQQQQLIQQLLMQAMQGTPNAITPLLQLVQQQQQQQQQSQAPQQQHNDLLRQLEAAQQAQAQAEAQRQQEAARAQAAQVAAAQQAQAQAQAQAQQAAQIQQLLMGGNPDLLRLLAAQAQQPQVQNRQTIDALALLQQQQQQQQQHQVALQQQQLQQQQQRLGMLSQQQQPPSSVAQQQLLYQIPGMLSAVQQHQQQQQQQPAKGPMTNGRQA